MIKKLFVPVLTYPDAHSEVIAQNSCAIASKFDAEIDLLFQGVSFPQLSNALGNAVADLPALVNEAKARSASHRKLIEAAFKGNAATSGRVLQAHALETYPPFFPESAAEAARYRDLSVLGIRSGTPSMTKLAEAVIFGGGRPALLVPDGVMLADMEHAAIAWDGSVVAARAVLDAMPFLVKAAHVTIVTVSDDKPLAQDEPGSKLSTYLKAHGCSAKVDAIERASRPISDSLQDYALRKGANLLVMGAFGHSRVRDFILGGATRGILENARLPILLSH